MNNNKSINKTIDYRIWRHCMKLGEYTGCHQLPKRSFFIFGYQFPICARCTGVLAGYLLAIPYYIYSSYCNLLSIFGCIIMFSDWFVQTCNIKESTNRRRFLTGILGGFGILSIQLNLLKKLLSH